MLIAFPDRFDANNSFRLSELERVLIFFKIGEINSIAYIAYFELSSVQLIDQRDSIDWQRESTIEQNDGFPFKLSVYL